MSIADKIEQIIAPYPKSDEEIGRLWEAMGSLILELENRNDLTERERETLEQAGQADGWDRKRSALSSLATMLRDRLPGPDGIPGRFKRTR